MSAVTRGPALAPLWRLGRDPAAWMTTADVFVILTAISLPWSVTLVAIFAVAWLVAMAPLLDIRAFLQ
ncbi:MAG: ligase, partial [Ramlibacter sp.]|nr:ligase [Ramlibacter sp.]